ncbi:MAG: GAF domain-containing protein [gamma proteobacterium symbiont of Bathyaustriella thionipta]|nr:GAF domain-containing protein [gamma proteobacterium symbiont of Bathyaustriella thionipta]MCU7950647.1 GAF domain-containing protein [gamma proteobacterium symbiont of Bathyaustriella thionipta]MCU7953739.1 GAF domain-containing protein [gamma proteobacterium symbiont of Bathyaustriella thionipta]MCU7957138.1 GAF domain-containing protein [gamma proteobacterium symbiont of Bathyaustriella thionipta]MCU7968435.1 GAF domain-containing protein [gamma proteobacterium symbiont of Bathyaustriella
MSNSASIFNQISKKLSRETNLQNQLEIVVDGAMDLTNADAGTLYSIFEEKFLKFEVVLNRSLNINKKSPETDFPDIPLYKDNVANASMVVVNSVLMEKSIFIDDIYDENQYNFSGTRAFDEKTGYQTHSVLTVPIYDFEKKIIGVIQLINAQDNDDNIRVFNDNDLELINLFIMQTAFTLSSKILIDKQKSLFKSIKVSSNV